MSLLRSEPRAGSVRPPDENPRQPHLVRHLLPLQPHLSPPFCLPPMLGCSWLTPYLRLLLPYALYPQSLSSSFTTRLRGPCSRSLSGVPPQVRGIARYCGSLRPLPPLESHIHALRHATLPLFPREWVECISPTPRECWPRPCDLLQPTAYGGNDGVAVLPLTLRRWPLV